MIYNPSGSTMARAIVCPPSHTLPRALETTDLAERGDELHGYIRLTIEGHPDPLSAVPEEYREDAAKLDIKRELEGLTVVGTEMAYVLDVSTGKVRFLGSNIGRKYGALSPYEVPCTLDLEAMVGGVPIAKDWKTGRHQTKAEGSWQMRLQACCLAAKYDADQVMVCLSYICNDWSEPATFDRMEMDGFLEQAKAAIDAIREATHNTPVSVGDHCTFCPSLVYCPAKNALLRSIVGVKHLELLAMTPEERGAAWAKAKDIEALLKIVQTTLREMAQQEPLPLDDKYEVRSTMSSKTSFDADAARGLLLQLGATPSQMAGLNKKITFPVVKRMKRESDD